MELHIEIMKLWNGFVGIVIRWLIWLVGEDMKFGKELCRDELSLELGLAHACSHMQDLDKSCKKGTYLNILDMMKSPGKR